MAAPVVVLPSQGTTVLSREPEANVAAVPAVGPQYVAWACIGVAVLGRLTAQAVPSSPSTDPGLVINWNPVSETWRNLKLAHGNLVVFRSLLGISWMWFFGAAFLAQFPAFAKSVLHGDEQVASLLLVVFSVGIGTGSLLCEVLSRRHVEIGLVPLGAILPPLRKVVWGRASSLSINPAFRRRPPEGEMKALVMWQEIGAMVWAWTLLASTQAIGWRPLLILLGVVSLTAVLNQLRTLVAHLWENGGEAMSVTAQFLDTVNVPPPGMIAEVWAPVGLRYHALHHLLPGVPYHNLAEAHRRLCRELEAESVYHHANRLGLAPLVGSLARSTMKRRPTA